MSKIGQKTRGRPENIGNFGLGNRNRRVEMLSNFVTKEKPYYLNSFFKKPLKRKW